MSCASHVCLTYAFLYSLSLVSSEGSGRSAFHVLCFLSMEDFTTQVMANSCFWDWPGEGVGMEGIGTGIRGLENQREC